MKVNNVVYNMDCLEYMKTIPDKYFELSICDPEYGISINHNMGRRAGDKKSSYKKVEWDSKIPDEIYFTELERISKKRIVWGGNYFTEFLLPVNSWILWHKMNDGVSFSMVEMAWTDLDINTKLFTLFNKQDKRIHPTQKPIMLYKWLLTNYAKPNDKIFDSHVGSGSSRIACYELGFDFIGCELDKDYWQAQEKRFELEKHKIDNKFYLPPDNNGLFNA